jgi:hypothetical protein
MARARLRYHFENEVVKPLLGTSRLFFRDGSVSLAEALSPNLQPKFWQSFGKVLAKFWQSFGKVLAKFWQSLGKVLAKFWRLSSGARAP